MTKQISLMKRWAAIVGLGLWAGAAFQHVPRLRKLE